MRTITNEEGTFIFLKSEEQVKNKKILIIVLVTLFILLDIFSFIKNGFNYLILIFEAIFILFLIWTYYVDKNDSKNPVLIMKDGILMNIIGKQDINFQDITKIEIPTLSDTLVITFTYNHKLSKQPIFSSNNPSMIKLIAERIKEYADNHGFVNIEYKNCLLFNEKNK